MKTLAVILAILMTVTPVFADCDFSKGIKANPDGTFTYSGECHRKVGDMVQDAKLKNQQVDKLNQSIQMKDLAIDTANTRVTKWQNTTFKLEDRVDAVEKMNDTNKVLYFVGGVLFTGLAVWAAGQLRK